MYIHLIDMHIHVFKTFLENYENGDNHWQGGRGVKQMLTKLTNAGEGGQAIADN